MQRSHWPMLVLILLLAGFSTYVIWPQRPENYLPAGIPWPQGQGIRLTIGNTTFERVGQPLGLDLEGGTNIILQADLSGVAPEDRQTTMTGLIRTIERRVNALGVSEPIIAQQGENRIQLQLAGVRDPEQARRLIGQTAQLVFKERRIGENGQPEDIDIGLTGADLRRASAGPNPNQGGVGRVVNFEFNERGAQIFAEVTARLAPTRGQIAIYLDNQVISAPAVNTAITGGRGFIEGNFTIDSANELAIQLNSGALQAPVTILRSQDVDATLGADSVRKSIVAGQIGLLTVAIFMILYYRLPGLISVAALLVYILVTLAIFRLIPVTLTLAGIAGFILSIGMAVDANVLIFERMREELRAGRSLNAAIEAGFSRAWSSIRDSNVATIITAVILYWFGSNFGATLVQGFALTLLIGVLVSMFSAITVSRTFLRVVQETFFASGDLTPRGAWLFGLDSVRSDRGRPNVSTSRTVTSR